MAGLLTAIGTGLGGFMAGYDKSRQDAQMAQARQMALQQARDANVAKGLAGFALTQGGVLNPLGGVPGSQQGSTPPMPGQPSVPTDPPPPASTAAPQSPYGPGPGLPLPSPSPAPPQRPPMQGSASSPDLGADEQTQDPEATVAADAAAESPAPVSPAAPAETGTPPSGDGSGGTAPAPAGGSAPAPAQATLPGQPFTAVDDKGNQVDIRPFLPQHFDPQQIAQRIKAARPGATDAQVWDATEMVYKLAESGNKSDVASAALLLRALGLQVRASQGQQSLAIRQQQADTGAARQQTTAAQGQQHISLGKQNLAVRQQQADTAAARAKSQEDAAKQRIQIAKDRLAAQQAQFKQRFDQAKTTTDLNQRGLMLRSLVTDIDRNIATASAAGETDVVAQLRKEREPIVNELRKITGMGPLPPPAPTSSGWHLPFSQ